MDQKRYEQSIQCVPNADSARYVKTEAQTAIITLLVLFYVHAANVQLSAFMCSCLPLKMLLTMQSTQLKYSLVL